ncbi:hypothetical protein [uncultured Litoreibacter sp.]|uniref:hypothetical protein n=1 Tax=uncultured Litoreibacter sp. TaxID=1392394 RepID=UPI002605CB21|nr:hypothetical protein [uncultured Litoreibacter sp.]
MNEPHPRYRSNKFYFTCGVVFSLAVIGLLFVGSFGFFIILIAGSVSVFEFIRALLGLVGPRSEQAYELVSQNVVTDNENVPPRVRLAFWGGFIMLLVMGQLAVFGGLPLWT